MNGNGKRIKLRLSFINPESKALLDLIRAENIITPEDVKKVI